MLKRYLSFENPMPHSQRFSDKCYMMMKALRAGFFDKCYMMMMALRAGFSDKCYMMMMALRFS